MRPRKGFYVVFSLISLVLFSASTLDLNNLFNYSGQVVPAYITKDNTAGNSITDEGATLGRVLFYDKKLSLNNTISCASCHIQELGFTDSLVQSVGLNGGLTERHSMRLINARFSNEDAFFWDERASTLEDQTTQPIKDHIEMGFSGQQGNPGIDSLISKMENINYYNVLFSLAFGNSSITEPKIQDALAQFVRSIQSFDSPFDLGLEAANGDINAPFPNFSSDENAGKTLFLAPAGGPQGGAGCEECHKPPEFDIIPVTGNNNIIGVAGNPSGIDLTNTRAPSLRGLFDANGDQIAPYMHDGSILSLEEVIEHYNLITWDPLVNPDLDNKLKMGGPNGTGQNLNLTQNEKDQLLAFLKTLSGTHVYSAEEYSNPFGANDSLSFTYIPEVEVLGRLKVSNIPELINNEGNKVLVAHPNGTISKIDNTLRVSDTNDTLFIGNQWIIVPGISNQN